MQQRYDALAADYDARWRRYNRAVHAEILRRLPRELKGARVLDIGCGTGEWLEQLLCRHAEIAQVVGIEPSREMLSVACARFAEFPSKVVVELRQENAESMVFSANSFDVVTCLNVMHYLEKPAQLFESAHRVLDVGGTLVVQDYTRNGWPLFGKMARVFDRGTQHLYAPKELNELAERAGFRVQIARTFRITRFWRGVVLKARKV